MAKLTKAFDSKKHEDIGNFEPIPAGKYVAAIVKSEMKKNRKKTGHFWELRFKILKGDYKGRLIWVRLNLDNPNPVAVEVAQKELASITRSAFGRDKQIQDTIELHDKPMYIKVVIRAGDNVNAPSNEIKAYKALKKNEVVEEVVEEEVVEEEFENVDEDLENEENSDTDDEDLEIDDDDDDDEEDLEIDDDDDDDIPW